MKKTLLLLLLLVLLFVSCSDNIRLSKEEYDKLTNVKKPEYPKSFYFKDDATNNYKWTIILGEDSHEYLRNNYYYESIVVIHYPDCKKCLSKDSVDVR